MDHDEWSNFVFENRDHLIDQLESLLPHTKFANIAPGLYPILHLLWHHLYY